MILKLILFFVINKVVLLEFTDAINASNFSSAIRKLVEKKMKKVTITKFCQISFSIISLAKIKIGNC